MFSSLALWQHESTTEERVVYGPMLFTTGQTGRGNSQHLPQRVTLSGAFVFLQVGDESPRGNLHKWLKCAKTASYKVPRLLKKLSDQQPLSEISSFQRKVDETCALVGCYTKSSSNYLPTFRDIL